MTEVKFVVKNYRCFNDDHPLEFILRDGFVGFVGPNNSGKSAILKFFYEFKPMWKIVGNESDLNELLLKSGRRIKLQLPYCDHDAIFHKFNNRPIEILIECKKTSLLLLIERVSDNEILFKKATFLCDGKEIQPIARGKRSFSVENKVFTSEQGEKFIISSLINFLALLEDTLYIPAFRNIANIGGKKSYYDITIGTDFIKAWNDCKNTIKSIQRTKAQIVERDIQEIFKFESFGIDVMNDSSNLIIRIDGKDYVLDEIGSGIAQFILVFIAGLIVRKKRKLVIYQKIVRSF